MLLIAGLILIVLGFGSGAGILASSIGWITVQHATTLWVLFPIASLLGLLLAALGSRTRSLPILVRISGAIMLLLSLAAVTMLVLGSIGIVSTPSGTTSLWYVFVVGLIAGSGGFLSTASPGQPA